MRMLIAVSIYALTLAAQAQTVTVPNAFVAGAAAKASEVNANFSTLAAGINALATRMARLEGQISAADMAGTYALKGIQMELAGGAGAHVASYVYSGTAVLRADGTGTLTTPQTGSQLNLFSQPSAIVGANRPAETSTFTWTLANGVLTAFGQTFAVSNGGRMLVSASSNPADGTDVMLIVSRLN